MPACRAPIIAGGLPTRAGGTCSRVGSSSVEAVTGVTGVGHCEGEKLKLRTGNQPAAAQNHLPALLSRLSSSVGEEHDYSCYWRSSGQGAARMDIWLVSGGGSLWSITVAHHLTGKSLPSVRTLTVVAIDSKPCAGPDCRAPPLRLPVLDCPVDFLA